MEDHLDFFKQYVAFKNSFPKTCLMKSVNGCDGKPINSHSISASALKLISLNGNVISPMIKPTSEDDESITKFKSIGIGKASTFPGFCHEHDNGLFGKADNIDSKVSENLVRELFYRSLSQEAYKKLVNSEFLKPINNSIDAIAHEQEYQEGQEIGYKFLAKQALEFTKNTSLKGGQIKYFVLVLPSIVPFAFLGCYSFELEKIERKFGPAYKLDNLHSALIGVIPKKEKSIFVCAWPSGNTRFLTDFLKRIKYAQNDLVELLFQLGIEKCENNFIAPHWYNELDMSSKNKISNFYDCTISGYSDPIYRPFENFFLPLKERIVLRTNSPKIKIWKKRVDIFY